MRRLVKKKEHQHEAQQRKTVNPAIKALANMIAPKIAYGTTEEALSILALLCSHNKPTMLSMIRSYK